MRYVVVCRDYAVEGNFTSVYSIRKYEEWVNFPIDLKIVGGPCGMREAKRLCQKLNDIAIVLRE